MTAAEQPPVFSLRWSRRAPRDRPGGDRSFQSHLDRSRVRLQTFLAGERLDCGRQALQPFSSHSLNGRETHEVRGVEPTAKSSGSVRRQDVVRSDRVVAGDLGCIPPDENRSSCSNCLGKPVVVAHQMLGSGTIGQVNRFLASGGDDDSSMPCERFPGGPCRRHLGGDGSGDFQSQRPAGGDENCARLGIVLGLCDEVGRYPVGIAFVGRDDDLGRTCIEIDCAIPRRPALGRGDVLVARANDLVTRGTVACRMPGLRSPARLPCETAG